MTRQHFHANGKLLLTGEYLVLHGATALALPTKLGQTLSVETEMETEHAPSVQWEARQLNEPWFSSKYDKDTLDILECDDPKKAKRLSTILKTVRSLNPHAFDRGGHFETHLEFNPEWGLGSSSTLVSNLARWAGVDPYQLLKATFGGSGYDIACATATAPIFYQLDGGLPSVRPAPFDPPFKEHLFLVYSGQKQSSAEEVRQFNKNFEPRHHDNELKAVSSISQELTTVTSLKEFRKHIDTLEETMSVCLQRKPLKTRWFLDFEGSIKSLGAWGGDFFLAATEWPYEKVKAYFQAKGRNTVLKYQDIIL